MPAYSFKSVSKVIKDIRRNLLQERHVDYAICNLTRYTRLVKPLLRLSPISRHSKRVCYLSGIVRMAVANPIELEAVAPVEKLADIRADELLNCFHAAWMELKVIADINNQVFKDDQLSAFFH